MIRSRAPPRRRPARASTEWACSVQVGFVTTTKVSPCTGEKKNETQSHPRFSGKVYVQHFYFDFIAGLGGYWASAFCQHWYHRVPLFILIDGLTTLALVTIVG